MKFSITYSTFLCFIVISYHSYSQANIVNAINSFIDTEFFTEFKKLKDKAEKSAFSFKTEQRRYKEDQVQEVLESYNGSVTRFNNILYKIKTDLTNKQRRKFMLELPEEYAKGLMLDFERAEDFYNDNYRKKILEFTESDRAGLGMAVLLPEILKYATMAFEVLKRVKAEIKKINDQIIDDHIIAPYRIKTWDEL